ncbi:MAG: 4Fe-4S binding protein [Gammaproteobacteria bacterium]|nr:4Fe-4S binding protein [Gammaproteobacteria bacterium]
MTERNSLPEETANAYASKLAMSAVKSLNFQATSLLQYSSSGRVAVIGSIEAQEFASRLNGNLHAQLILTSGAEEPGVPTIAVGNRDLQIEGYLGNFNILLGDEGKANYEKVSVDLVVDLSADGVLKMPLKPPGYFTSIMEEPYLTLLEEELKDLTGTFEKPKYFDYDDSICAHGRSGVAGCTLCIDACPAQAITSLINSIQVDPYLCQGGGVCTSVCPTGAIRYVYPNVTDTLRTVSTLLNSYCEAGGSDPVIGFIAEDEAALLDLKAENNQADNLLVIVVEELASVGMEVWLNALACGAKSVLLIDGGSMFESVGVFLKSQINTANTILSGLSYKDKLIRIVDPQSLQQQCEVAQSIHFSDETFESASYFALLDTHMNNALYNNADKRRTTLLATDFLYAHSSSPEPIIELSEQSPFGRIMVDADACTLCMSCVSVCPTKAISAGDEVPKLVFREIKCVQCGICESACPERAISLEPRFITDAKQRRGFVTLHEELPFCCITCGKEFATKSMIDNMTQKLSGHYMFQSERARLRLMMCDQCRVVDVVQDNEAMDAI